MFTCCLLSPQASKVEVDVALLGSYVMFIEEQCSADDLHDAVEVSHTPFSSYSHQLQQLLVVNVHPKILIAYLLLVEDNIM